MTRHTTHLGPRFDEVDKHERAYSRRILWIAGLMIGPSVALLALGFYDAAMWAFLVNVGIGAAVVFIYQKADLIEGLGLNVLLSAAIVILAERLWHLLSGWLLSLFF
jgi:hypothetical protein